MQFPMRAALLAGAALLLARPAWAEPLTLKEAVERAVASSPDLQARGAGIDAARAGPGKHRRRFAPIRHYRSRPRISEAPAATACSSNPN